MAFKTGIGKLSLPVSGRDHIRGPEAATVTLLEYGDYQCSYCRQAYPIVEAVQKQLENRLRFVYRHFPISQIHPYAQLAAEAAEAAAMQGKFWEMHEQLFTSQPLEIDNLKKLAAEIGVDSVSFNNDLETHTHANRVRIDFESGLQSGVNGTPSFFINGTRYGGSWYEDRLLAAIRAEMKKL